MDQPTPITVDHEPGGRLPNGTPNGIGGTTRYIVKGVAFLTPQLAKVAADVWDRGITYVSPLREPVETSAVLPLVTDVSASPLTGTHRPRSR